MAEHHALFAAGCFWGVEEGFLSTPGVTRTQVGYAGGSTENPTYQEVCGGATGHAEVVWVTFDSARVSYAQLLERFWSLHDPTQLNRQGPDQGTQYRSAIFYLNDEQMNLAHASMQAFSGHFSRPIVTEVTAAPAFFPAEEYHQKYIRKRSRHCDSAFAKSP